MKNRGTKQFLIILIVMLFILMGCSQVDEPGLAQSTELSDPPTHTSIPLTSTEALPTKTSIPPSATLVPPTETLIPTQLPPTETLTLEPTKDLPEFLVTQMADMVGKWEPEKTKVWFMTFNLEGITKLLRSDGSVQDTMPCRFEGELLTCENVCPETDVNSGLSTDVPCTIQYKVYLTKDGDTPVRLRYELVDDPYVIRSSLFTAQIWYWLAAK